MVEKVLLSKSTCVLKGGMPNIGSNYLIYFLRKGVRCSKVPVWIIHPPLPYTHTSTHTSSEKGSVVMIAALLRRYYFPPHVLPRLVRLRSRFQIPAEPVSLLRLSTSSSIHVQLLCAPPSASGDCPSPP